MPSLSVMRKRDNYAPTAPKQSDTLAYRIGYEIALDIRRADVIIEDCCQRDRDDYAAGMAKGRREMAKAEEQFAAEQAQERRLLTEITRGRRKSG